MNRLLVILILVLVTIVDVNSQVAGDSYQSSLGMLKAYAEKYEPNYVVGADTFLIARIAPLPDTLNLFLYASIKAKSRETYKYAFLVVMKLANEFRRNSRTDHDFCSYEGNGIIDMVFDAMNKSHIDESCFMTRTYEVYLWLRQHGNVYKDYKPLIHEMTIMEDYLKRRKY